MRKRKKSDFMGRRANPFKAYNHLGMRHWDDVYELGACRNVPDVDFGLEGPLHGEAKARALRFCESCPVRLRCLQMALIDNLTFGIYGGHTASYRIARRKECFLEIRTANAKNKRVHAEPRH